MPRQETGQENVRKLGRTGSPTNPSYYVTLPIEFIRNLGWRDGQKVVIKYNEDDNSLIITDNK